MRTPADVVRAPHARGRTLAGAAALVLAGVVPLAPPAAASPAASSGWVEAPALALLVDATEPAAGRVEAPAHDHDHDEAVAGAPAAATSTTSGAVGSFTAPANTDFLLRFDPSVDPATRQVLTAAAGVWSAVLDVRVPIEVEVVVEPMAPGMLGAAGPVRGYFGEPSFPRGDVLYPGALANQLAGTDIDPGVADIALELSSTMTWDRAVDGSVSPTGQSMLSVAIHELAHGLGHTSWVHPTATGWSATYLRDGLTLATPYDRLVTTSAGTSIASLPDAQVTTAVVSPMRWGGAGGRTANGGVPPALYGPAVFEQGSSIGHLDEATFRSGIMTPFLARGEVHTSIPAVTRAMLADLGWRLQPTGTTTDGTTSPPVPSPSPTAAQRAGAYVDAVSRDFLGRAATTAELTRWRDHLLAGGSRQDVARAYAFSDEWIGVLVDGLYRSTLGRAPDPAGRAHWIGVLRAGEIPARVAAQFYASDEYFRRAGGTPTAWISDLYAEILGRAPDATGLAWWVARAATTPRSAIALDLHQSLESRRDRVAALFRTLLDRAPDPGGWAYWAGVLTSGRDLDLAVFLAASDEYYARAGQQA